MSDDNESFLTKEWLLKICVVGSDSDLNFEFGTLKTDFVHSKEMFSVLGFAVEVKRLEVDNQKIRLRVEICAGEDRFKKLRSSYLENSGGCCIIYDKGKRETFERVTDFYEEYRRIRDNPVILVGIIGEPQEEIAKEAPFLRLAISEEVTTEEGQELADKLGIKYIETAIHDREKVEEILVNLVKSCVKEISTQ